MNPDDFNKALRIATGYFVTIGLYNTSIARSLGQHILDLFQNGEKRPVMLGNRAIERMERQLAAEMELNTEQLRVAYYRKA